MTKLTYSNASNAVRGFRTLFPMLADRLGNEAVRFDFIDRDQAGTFSINVEAVADYQQELLGVVTSSVVEGVPVLRRSVKGMSTAQVRDMFQALPEGTTRKDALALAVSQGVAFYTARTQYSRVVHGK